jgi:RimJ/RimL family protein N-acetyltransferase
MIYKLNHEDYYLVKSLIKDSCPELSVFSVIAGIIPGEIYVDNQEHPKSALIKTPECNLLAGCANNSGFNAEVKELLDFWDHVTFDTAQWDEKIHGVHKNRFIRKYKRMYYVLNKLKYQDYANDLKCQYKLEKIDACKIQESVKKNSERIRDWIENWGSNDNFNQNGAGFMVSDEDNIVSWCLADCAYDNKIAIGINTDENYRKKGLGAIAAAAVIDYCLSKGIEEIHWLCVDSNKGSIALAEKLGFTLKKEYFSYTPYPPIENEDDLSPSQWEEWAIYYQEANKLEPKFFIDEAHCWAKAHKVEGTINSLKGHIESGMKLSADKLSQHRTYSRFKDNPQWQSFLEDLRTT